MTQRESDLLDAAVKANEFNSLIRLLRAGLGRISLWAPEAIPQIMNTLELVLALEKELRGLAAKIDELSIK